MKITNPQEEKIYLTIIFNQDKKVSLVNDTVGTFMGAFNAYAIQQLKSKFNNLHSGHCKLVRVTNQHDEDIKNLSDNMQSVAEVIDLPAE
jgi:hypothetical protein